MPTTYSTNLKLAMMATGENNNVWGVTNNTNLGTLLEQAIVGMGTVAMADADQTVTILDGASSTGRNFYIKCTGVLTADRYLTVPTLNKNYIVENATTGGFNVYVRTAAGASVPVASGYRRMVYVNGTDVIDGLTQFGAIGAVSLGSGSVSTTTLTVNSTGSIPTLTVATSLTAALVNGLSIAPTTGGSLTINNGKALQFSNTMNIAGTDGCTYTMPSTSGNIALDMVGEIRGYAFATPPSGWLQCNGQEVSRTTYSALNALMAAQTPAYPYGAGNGSTTFNLPDLRGRVPAGSDTMSTGAAGRLTSATMSPNGQQLGATGGTQQVTLTAPEQASMSVTGTATTTGTIVTPTGIVNTGGYGTLLGQSSPSGGFNIYSDVSPTTSGSGTISGTANGGNGPHLNVQPTLVIYWIIKT